MSVIDRVVAAVTPPESEEDRIEARQRAREAAMSSPWLAQVLDHHEAIDAAFAKARAASDAGSRTAALKELGKILTGHSIAEEVAIYPALADTGEKGHATMAYTEQSAAKMQMGLLERLDPMSQDWMDKLEHIEGAVKHHVYEEEGTWFVELCENGDAAQQQMIAQRYEEEFNRYMGSDGIGGQSSGQGSAFFAGGTDTTRTDQGDYANRDRDDGLGSDAMRTEDDYPVSSGSSIDDTSGGDDLMSPGRSTTGLPEFR